MKTLFIIVAVIGIGFFALYERPSKPENFAKPTFKSVVIEDGRSFCDKTSEMYFIAHWEDACAEAGQPSDCRLGERDVDTIVTASGFVHQNCELAIVKR